MTALLAAVSAAAVPPDAAPASDPGSALTDITAEPAAFDTDLTWTATEEEPARFWIDAPSAGLLSLIAVSDDGDDLRVVVADRTGIYRPLGDIDYDPSNVTGGEFGAVVIPAGPSTVIVGSFEGRQTGTLKLGFLPTPGVADQPERFDLFRTALPLTEGEAVTGRAPGIDEARGGETQRCYVAAHGETSVLRLRYHVTDGTDLEVYLYRSAAMWWPVEYDAGPEGTLTFYPQPGETWFAVVNSGDLNEGVSYTLSLDDPSRPARRAPR